MMGFFQRISIFICVLLFLVIFQDDSRAKSKNVFSVDIHSGVVFHEEDKHALISLYLNYKGAFTPRRPNWARGVRVRYDAPTQNSKFYGGLIAGYRSIDQVFIQQLQPNNFGVVYSKTDILLRQHILTGGVRVSRRVKTAENSSLSIHANIEMIVPFMDVIRIDTEVLRYLDDSPQHYHHSKRINNLQNSFDIFRSYPDFNVGLEISYTFLINKWGLKPFICGEYMNLYNRNIFLSSVGLGFEWR